MNTVYNFQFANRKQRRWFIVAITSLALLLFLWVLFSGLSRTYETYKERKAASKNEVIFNRPGTKPKYSIDTVVKTKLFGDQQKKTVVKRVEKAPETKLDLAIVGLLSANNDRIARAIISVKKKQGQLYKVGDDIKGANAVLEEIREDGVLLNRNGIIENLAFVKKTISGNRKISNFSSPNASFNSGVTNTRASNSSNNSAVNRSRPVNNGNFEANTKRRSVKKPNFKGLDAAIERKLNAALDEINL